jgi:hypothetical protein
MSQKFDKNIIKIYIFRKIHTIVVYKTQHFSFRFLVLTLTIQRIEQKFSKVQDKEKFWETFNA